MFLWKLTLLAVIKVDNITVYIIFLISHFVAVIRILEEKKGTGREKNNSNIFCFHLTHVPRCCSFVHF